jgi:hypothetical protein
MRLLRIPLVLAGLAVSSIAWADAKAELGRKLLETSGVKSQVEQIPQMLEGSMEQYRQTGKLPGAQFDALARVVRNRFGASAFYPVLEEGFLKAVDEKVLQDVNRWHQTPFGKKVTELEDSASRSESQGELQQYAQAMQDSPPLAARLKLIQRVDDAVLGTESSLEMMDGVTRGLLRGLMSVAPSGAGDAMSDQQIQKQLATMRTQLRPVLHSATQVSYLFTYRTLSDKELAEYVKYLSTPSARAFHRAIAKGFQLAFEDASARIGKDLAATLGPPAGKPGK